ncbi:MAG: ferrous iron transport protein A [Candidatus Latescibacterota bacterium]|nr:MAG: ferrous iron transport protein A [Candidatus Latescibacterota bacterium]
MSCLKIGGEYMSDKEVVSLLHMKSGSRGQVVEITGGIGFQSHLDSLGIRRGKIVQKLAAHPLRGPIVIELDGTRIAIGRRMANRILLKELGANRT